MDSTERQTQRDLAAWTCYWVLNAGISQILRLQVSSLRSKFTEPAAKKIKTTPHL